MAVRRSSTRKNSRTMKMSRVQRNEQISNEIFKNGQVRRNNRDKRKEYRETKFSKKEKIIIGVFLGVILLFLALFLFYNSVIKLTGKDVLIDYGKKYKEPGYSVKLFGKDYTKNVKIKNNINLKKLGKYIVTYSVKIGGITYKKTRMVSLIDREKPKIELTGKKNTDVCPDTNYKEEGYKATDNYDKDLTKKVKVNASKDKIIYFVVDSSGNKAEITRKLTYQDKTAPEVTLNGDETVYVIEGGEFKDEGAKANDNCDGDVTKNIKSEGSVDNNKAGEYKISYKVSDKAKNEGIKTRTVSVLKKSNLNAGIPGTIYLTFDDGPNEGTTNVILDILKEEGVKATFFVTNNGPDSLIKREHDEGHTVALHTATHDYATVYASDESYYKDLTAVQDRVKRITGETSMIIRFPGGSSNTVSRKYSPGIMTRLTQSTLSKGFKYYDWNISSGDAGETTAADGVYNNVISRISKDKANMVLMHDIKTYTRDALRRIIKYGKENGYKFEKITMNTAMITQRVNN